MGANSNRAFDDAPRIDCADGKKRMAKAELQSLTIREKRAEYGAVLRRASEIAGLNRDQTADELQVDKAQVSRWWSGDENAQSWRYQQHPTLRLAYLRAQGEVEHTRVRVRTVIEIEEAS